MIDSSCLHKTCSTKRPIPLTTSLLTFKHVLGTSSLDSKIILHKPLSKPIWSYEIKPSNLNEIEIKDIATANFYVSNLSTAAVQNVAKIF